MVFFCFQSTWRATCHAIVWGSQGPAGGSKLFKRARQHAPKPSLVFDTTQSQPLHPFAGPAFTCDILLPITCDTKRSKHCACHEIQLQKLALAGLGEAGGGVGFFQLRFAPYCAGAQRHFGYCREVPQRACLQTLERATKWLGHIPRAQMQKHILGAISTAEVCQVWHSFRSNGHVSERSAV